MASDRVMALVYVQKELLGLHCFDIMEYFTETSEKG